MKKVDASFMEQVKRTDGLNCPCCGQFAKVYKRKLNAEVAYGLIMLVKFGEKYTFNKFHHVATIMDGYGSKLVGGDFAKGAYWGLIEPMPNTDSTKRTSGMWRLTGKGIAFALMRTSMPSHVYVYNGEVLGVSEELVSIKRALHRRFNYAELMAG